MQLDFIHEILDPPLRERERVEKALARAEPKDCLLLTLVLNQGEVRGDWRRVLVRRRVVELVNAGGFRAACSELRKAMPRGVPLAGPRTTTTN